MKKRNLLLSLLLLLIVSFPVYADSLESVRVIKFWDATDDMVIERTSGDRLLLQHNRACSTMSTEFPIKIIWSDDKIVEAKVAANEQCDVYNFGPYSSDIIISKRIPSPNALTAEYQAEVDWKGGRYQIEYGEGCKNLRNYVNKTAYVYTPNSKLEGGTLYLPKARGECDIVSSELVENLNTHPDLLESPIKNLSHKAENNQVFFSWDKFPENENWLVLIAHSKYQLDPSEYTLAQMPKLKRTKTNSMRILQLKNDQNYYFYVTAGNGEGQLTPWIEVPLTPVQTTRRFVNNPDPERFEIEMTETNNTFRLSWPDKGDVSRKYMIQLFVDGKRQLFKLIDADVPEFAIEKKPEWAKSRFRMTVRSIPKKPTGLRYFDSIFWRKG